ncbi:aminotransferase class I/II-fold pyridoxal phosphate-dependent enzyme [bacterium]|nr:aminotransferase class I/II-fold pyridoxal phosphate-dependent enzyme [bacterium]
MNQSFEQIRQSSTVAIADRVLALKASGREIIPLQTGDPDFGTPDSVIQIALQAMSDGLTHYGPSRGYLEFRMAAADKLARDQKISSTEAMTYDPESEILVTHGGIHGYYLAIQSILNPGDEVLIPNPSWPTHANMVRLMRGNPISIPASFENGFIPPLTAWKNALTPQTRAIVINYPANPTGAYPSREYLFELQKFAAENKLWLISDEVYQSLTYQEKAISAGAFPHVKDHTILVNSLSKTYAMTGWRVGYLAAPRSIIDNALKAGQNSITCVAPFIQKAAAFALTNADVQDEVRKMHQSYTHRREMVLQISREYENSPIRVHPPQGALYFFLDFRELKRTSLEICEQILDDVGVGLVPGSAFGSQGEGFVRMAITASDETVETGFRKIMDWANNQVSG